MHNAFSTLLGPVLVLWLGALVFYVLDRFLEPQDAGLAETIVLALATGTLVLGRSRLGTTFPFGRALVAAGWPVSTPSLLLEHTSWVLALVVLAIALAASLASLGREVRGRAGRMAMLGALLLLFSAKDWATLALLWVLVDVSLTYAITEASHRGKERAETAQTHRRAAFLSLSSAMLLGLAVTLWQLSGGDLAAATTPPWPIAGLVLVAGLLRLQLWPLPSWYDWEESAGDGLRNETPLARVVPFLATILSSAYLWARMGSESETAAGGHWLTALSLWAGVALVISALKAWGARDPGQLIDRTAPYGAALALLAVGLGLPPRWQMLVGAGAALNVCALHVAWTQCQYLDPADPRSSWRVAPTGLALLSLAGLPLTIGFSARAAIVSQVFADGRWLVLLLTLVGEAGMLGALLRVLLDVECTLSESENVKGFSPAAWLRNLGYGAGAALALGGVILGIAPVLLGAPRLLFWFRLPKIHVWAALLLPAVGAIALYRAQEPLTEWMDEWWPLIRRLLDVRWIFGGLERVAHLIGAAVWTGTRVVEGAGYTAWVLLFCLVALLFLRTR